MKVTSKIKIKQTAIKAITSKAHAALEHTAEELHKEVEQAQVIPRDTGTLQNESTFVDTSQSGQGKVSIVSSTPYARRLYYHPEYNFHQNDWEEEIKHRDGKTETIKHGSNPNAKAHWFEDWQKGGKHEDFCNNSFAKNMRRLMR